MKQGWQSLRSGICLVIGSVSPLFAQSGAAPTPGIARPTEVLKQLVTGLPRDSAQEIRVMTATFQPGDRTVFHTHPWPVTVYVLEGTFTLELEGQKPVTLKAGQAMVEPAGVRMTGYDRSTTEKTQVVIFYVSEPGAPFLHPMPDTSSRRRPDER